MFSRFARFCRSAGFHGFHTLPQSRAGFNRHGGFLTTLHCAGRIPLRSTAFRGVRIFAYVSENFSGTLPRCQHSQYFPIRSRLTTSVGTLLKLQGHALLSATFGLRAALRGVDGRLQAFTTASWRFRTRAAVSDFC